MGLLEPAWLSRRGTTICFTPCGCCLLYSTNVLTRHLQLSVLLRRPDRDLKTAPTSSLSASAIPFWLTSTKTRSAWQSVQAIHIALEIFRLTQSIVACLRRRRSCEVLGFQHRGTLDRSELHTSSHQSRIRRSTNETAMNAAESLSRMPTDVAFATMGLAFPRHRRSRCARRPAKLLWSAFGGLNIRRPSLGDTRVVILVIAEPRALLREAAALAAYVDVIAD